MNISSGIETSVREVFDEIAGLLSVDTPPRYGPPRPGDVHRVWLDPSRAMSELGWRATVPLREGLAELVSVMSPASAVTE
jgi:nucleoside-diphosphate-sugar epimerase